MQDLMTKEYKTLHMFRNTVTDALADLDILISTYLQRSWKLEGGVNVIKTSSEDALEKVFVAFQAVSKNTND